MQVKREKENQNQTNKKTQKEKTHTQQALGMLYVKLTGICFDAVSSGPLIHGS